MSRRPADYAYLSGFNARAMEPYIDFFNFMSYDFHGPWDAPVLGAFILPQTSILDVDNALLPLWFDSVDPSKVNLGLAYYGRGYTASSPSCLQINCPYSAPSNAGPCTNSPGLLSLREIEELIDVDGLVPELLEDLMIKQITWGDDQWMGYDDNETFAMKIAYANNRCLGGTMFWSIDLYSGPGRYLLHLYISE